MYKKLLIVAAMFGLIVLSGCGSKNASRYSGMDNVYVDEFQENIGDRIFFDLASCTVNNMGHMTLKMQAKWLNSHPDMSLIIEGHCDERGTREFNIALGERRAYAVKMALIKYGVDEERIETISYGKERPAVIGDDESSWSKNRRAVTTLR